MKFSKNSSIDQFYLREVYERVRKVFKNSSSVQNPRITPEEIFDTLQGSAYFTTIDMSWGFYQLPMEPKSQNYRAFSTTFGSFKWLRMPMGLTVSQNTFQSLMEHVLVGLTWNITVPCLDDCIIFSKTPEEHIKRLQQVFQRFCEAILKINPTKCAFFQTKAQFLGHVIRKTDCKPIPKKLQQFKTLRYHKTKLMLSRS